MISDGRTYSTQFKSNLPIDDYKKTILYLLEKHNVLIVSGETGSGKSTRLPQILYSAGIYTELSNQSHVICITEPRRVAALQLAQRVANDIKCSLGTTVGYAIRFKDVTKEDETVIKFMTEGLLVREMLFDPLLMKYSVIMVDEVHERNLNTDLLLGLLKCLLLKRKDLKLIICSATLNIDQLYNFFHYEDKYLSVDDMALKKPAVTFIQGKTFPLAIYYREQPVPNYMEAAVETVINIHESSFLASGKILVFLTGQDEVDYVCDKLSDYAKTSSSRMELKKLLVLPLHASLKPEVISEVFDEHGRNTRVCIVSTNIAETSLTINDIAHVIDCGFSKLKIYDHKTGIDSLRRIPISKSSAKQRAGRAGRTRNGSVYRLYTEDEYSKLPEDTLPEIQRSSLVEPIMLLKSLGVEDIQGFPLLSHMPRDNLVSAIETLYALQAIDLTGKLTQNGEIMSRFNLDPRISKMLISPEGSICNQDICKIAAMLQVKEIYFKSSKYASDMWSNNHLTNICVSEGDLPSYLNIFNGFLSNNKSQRWAEKRNLNYQALLNAIEISKKLESQLKKCGFNLASENCRVDTIRKCLVTGLFSNAAYLHPNGDYKTIRGEETVYIHPTSIYSELIERPKYVVFVEILNTTKAYMRHIMSIESDWLLEAAPHYYSFSTSLELTRNKC